MAILMFVDHVLRSHTGTPIKQGLSLYKRLKETEQVLLLCSHKARDDRWLKENKINLVDDLIGPEVSYLHDDEAFRQVQYCRTNWPVTMVITGDTELSVKLIANGITTLLFLQPTYISEKFRPDSRQGVKTWAELTEGIIKQQESLIEDHRIQDL